MTGDFLRFLATVLCLPILCISISARVVWECLKIGWGIGLELFEWLER